MTHYCPVHPQTVLICPRCIAGAGGKATAKKYGTKQLSDWGRRGGKKKKHRHAPADKPAAGRKNKK